MRKGSAIATRNLVCWCVGVLVFWCFGVGVGLGVVSTRCPF